MSCSAVPGKVLTDGVSVAMLSCLTTHICFVRPAHGHQRASKSGSSTGKGALRVRSKVVDPWPNVAGVEPDPPHRPRGPILFGNAIAGIHCVKGVKGRV